MAWKLKNWSMKTEHSQVDIKQGTSCSRHSDFFKIVQKLSLVCLISASARHKGRKFTDAIAVRSQSKCLVQKNFVQLETQDNFRSKVWPNWTANQALGAPLPSARQSTVSGWVFGYWGVSGEGLQVHIEMTSCRHTEVIYTNGVHSAAQQAVF